MNRIRDVIKAAKQALIHYKKEDKQHVIDTMDFVIREVTDMIFKEENIYSRLHLSI